MHIADIYTGSSDDISYEENIQDDDSEESENYDKENNETRVNEEIHFSFCFIFYFS